MSDPSTLVRDEIPPVARGTGDDPAVHDADDEAYGRRVREKRPEEGEAPRRERPPGRQQAAEDRQRRSRGAGRRARRVEKRYVLRAVRGE